MAMAAPKKSAELAEKAHGHKAPDAVVLGVPVDREDDVEAGELLEVHSQLLKDAQAEVRRGFVRKVYGILSAQLLLTVAIAAPLHLAADSWLKSHSWLFMASLFLTLVTVCAMACCQSVARAYPTNYLVLFGFTACEAVVVGFISASYTWQSVLLCAGLTAVVFLGLTAYACTTKADFTGMGPYLFGCLLALCTWGLVAGLLMSLGVAVPWATLFFDLVGMLIFVLYTVFDTQMILGGEHAKHQFEVDDYVFAALNIYLDIIQLFLHLLRLLGEEN